MRVIIGMLPAERAHGGPVEESNCLDFDTGFLPYRGYHLYLVSAFDEFSQRENGCIMNFSPNLVVLRQGDFDVLLGILDAQEKKLAAQPAIWRDYKGEVGGRDEPVTVFNQVITRARMSKILQALRELIWSAREHDMVLVYGNGPFYERLRGIPPAPPLPRFGPLFP